MPKQFDSDLRQLKSRLLHMSSITERMIHDAKTALENWDVDALDPVDDAEDTLDMMQREIDEETIRLIGIYTPVAGDLRFLLMVTRINAELERIGDQIMNIQFYCKQMMQKSPIKPLVGVPLMAEKVQLMLKKVMDAFTERSSGLAREVIGSDDTIDKLNDQLFRELMTYVLGDAKTITQVFELILIARSLERIGDHAVDIAEDVVYMVEGEDIRHIDAEHNAMGGGKIQERQ